MTTTNSQLDPNTLAIVKALAYTENGGAPDLADPSAGQSGEMKSIFQFEPGTWKMYSKEILGKDNAPLNNANEVAVVTGKVNKWLQEGYSTEEIASLWNSGRPDGYKNLKGTNSKGIAYDTPAYAKKVVAYANTFEKDANNPGNQIAMQSNQPTGLMGGQSSTPPQTQTNQPQSQSQPQTPTQNAGLLPPQMKQVRQV